MGNRLHHYVDRRHLASGLRVPHDIHRQPVPEGIGDRRRDHDDSRRCWWLETVHHDQYYGSDFMKNVKVKDFRQGKTFYYVMAFPLDKQMGGHAKVDVYDIQSIAYKLPGDRNSLGLWYKTNEWREDWFTKQPKLRSDKHSLRDSGVAAGKTNYNFHRIFKTRNQAQRYADRMNSGCLTAEERKHALRLNVRRDCWSDYGY